MTDPIPIQTYRCRFCSHEWHPRSVKIPAKCPACFKHHWQEPREGGETDKGIIPLDNGVKSC